MSVKSPNKIVMPLGILGNYGQELSGVVYQKNGRIRIGRIAKKKRRNKSEK